MHGAEIDKSSYLLAIVARFVITASDKVGELITADAIET